MGLKLILDFVPNHTSDRHPWFLESRAARAGAKRDWYIWHDPAPGGGPPTNWRSEFGGPAWEWGAATGQYYYHAYLKEQPDLNWRNPEVRDALHEVLRFWLDRGVDGFRVDTIHHLIKDSERRDNPGNPDFKPGMPPHRRHLRLDTTARPGVLGNHDRSRIASRVGAAQARVAAMLLLTLRGTPTLYYGDEIGTRDVAISPAEVQDPWEKNVPGLGVGRDPGAPPMPWDGSANGGFPVGKPWLPLADEHERENVEALTTDPRSILSLYRALIALRRAEPALAIGRYEPLAAGPDLLAYVREHGGRRLVVVLNLTSHPRRLELPSGVTQGRILLATGLDRTGEPLEGVTELGADEGLIADVSGTPG